MRCTSSIATSSPTTCSWRSAPRTRPFSSSSTSASRRKRPGAERRRLGAPDRRQRAVWNALYMSPEQLRSAGDVDARTDVWALGIVFFELLTGSPPFEAANVPELCVAILSAEPKRLRSMLPAAPAALQAVMTHACRRTATSASGTWRSSRRSWCLRRLDASARVGRIKQVVRRGGHSMRPLTPAAGFEAQSAHIVITADVARSDRAGRSASIVQLPRRLQRRMGMALVRASGVGSPRDAALTRFSKGTSGTAAPLPTASEVSARQRAVCGLCDSDGYSSTSAAQPEEAAAARVERDAGVCLLGRCRVSAGCGRDSPARGARALGERHEAAALAGSFPFVRRSRHASANRAG